MMIGLVLFTAMAVIVIVIGVCLAFGISYLAGSAWGFIFFGAFLLAILIALLVLSAKVAKNGGAK